MGKLKTILSRLKRVTMGDTYSSTLTSERFNAIQDALKELGSEFNRLDSVAKGLTARQKNPNLKQSETRVYSFMPSDAADALCKLPPAERPKNSIRRNLTS